MIQVIRKNDFLTKKNVLYFFLAVLSLLFGACLGALNLFGFFDERQAINISLLLISILSVYAISIVLFLLNFAPGNHLIRIFTISCLIFGIIFIFSSSNILSSAATTFIYFIFLNFTYNEVFKRSQLFVKFLPNEIFFPILKKSMTYILIVFALLSFFQTQQKIISNNLITPGSLKFLSKPLIETFNKQFSTEIKNQLGDQYQLFLQSKQRDTLVKTALSQSLDPILKTKPISYLELSVDDFEVEKVIIYPDGEIEISPALESLYPVISNRLNIIVRRYALLIPFVIAMVIALLIRPLFWLIAPIEFGLTFAIFKILIKTGFIKITKKQTAVDQVIF